MTKTTMMKTSEYDKKKPETIQKMFGQIASKYDRTNAIVSFNLHKTWNQKFVKEVGTINQSASLLDLCCGTGEIAIYWMKRQQMSSKVYFLDFCEEMLACAKVKTETISHPHTLTFIEGDAMNLPFENEVHDYVTVAYGVRNIQNPSKCFEESYRVLKKGGVFAILELSTPSNKIMRFGHGFYLNNIMPFLGKFSTTNKEAYNYLCTSIENCMSPEQMSKQLYAVGFSQVTKIPLFGGVATIVKAIK